jgi:hypothetical protein
MEILLVALIGKYSCGRDDCSLVAAITVQTAGRRYYSAGNAET